MLSLTYLYSIYNATLLVIASSSNPEGILDAEENIQKKWQRDWIDLG